eukprot:GHVL01012590.1.p3 GENE.GHVL01012590.1~~GHVL01012590.1.p3  ORF type:complete len:390 (+),score=72.38 GHVL01012590.1:56-1225(+)
MTNSNRAPAALHSDIIHSFNNQFEEDEQSSDSSEVSYYSAPDQPVKFDESNTEVTVTPWLDIQEPSFGFSDQTPVYSASSNTVIENRFIFDNNDETNDGSCGQDSLKRKRASMLRIPTSRRWNQCLPGDVTAGPFLTPFGNSPCTTFTLAIDANKLTDSENLSSETPINPPPSIPPPPLTPYKREEERSPRPSFSKLPSSACAGCRSCQNASSRAEAISPISELVSDEPINELVRDEPMKTIPTWKESTVCSNLWRIDQASICSGITPNYCSFCQSSDEAFGGYRHVTAVNKPTIERETNNDRKYLDKSDVGCASVSCLSFLWTFSLVDFIKCELCGSASVLKIKKKKKHTKIFKKYQFLCIWQSKNNCYYKRFKHCIRLLWNEFSKNN